MSDDLKILKKDYDVNSMVVNFKGRLGLYSLLNILQDIAWEHAHRLGFGFDSISKQSLIWALTRQKLILRKWPKWGEKLTIETWVRPNETYALREFMIYSGNELIGECSTSWLTLNHETRRPAKFDRSAFNLYPEDKSLPFHAEKVPAMTDSEPLLTFNVRNSDIDVNRHVNNTKYAQWILDSIPQSWHIEFDLKEYEVNFLAETKLGDEITISKSRESESPEKTRWTTFQGLRSSDQKVVFTARLLISQK